MGFWDFLAHTMITLIVSASVSVLTAYLAARQQDKAFTRQAEQQREAFERQERRKALFERYTMQRQSFEEYLRRWQLEYRGEKGAPALNKRTEDNAPFFGRVLLAFGDALVSKAVSDSMVMAREDMGTAIDGDEAAQARMLECIRPIEKELGLEPVKPKASVMQLLKSEDAKKESSDGR